jgi:hypothetical protein
VFALWTIWRPEVLHPEIEGGLAMQRREFLRAIAGAVTWPLAVCAQSMPLIGFLSSRSPEDSKPHLAGFLRELEAFGYADGTTARIEYRWANGQYDLLRKLAGRRSAVRARSKVGHQHNSDYIRCGRFGKRGRGFQP